ncbi:hypothetical protein BCR44DRAFT_1436160 [Catenaria anguillulae PL171]|uniref:Uncharacterized protein n=1 Tax=Catenaria anguillulae PL171 TaxID=765915 RepID=A0A1Y2HNE0_9FUNG|nr:hypothetical protein BCR44DRAFT_1436160 [Catenaria anguillulae PL171]
MPHGLVVLTLLLSFSLDAVPGHLSVGTGQRLGFRTPRHRFNTTVGGLDGYMSGPEDDKPLRTTWVCAPEAFAKFTESVAGRTCYCPGALTRTCLSGAKVAWTTSQASDNSRPTPSTRAFRW